MATPCLQEEEMLAEKLQGFTGLYDKWFKGFKEKYAVQNAWEKVGESLDFEENGNFIRTSSNWEHFEDSCSEKIDALFCVRNPYEKHQQINLIFADVILDFDRLTIKNSSFP